MTYTFNLMATSDTGNYEIGIDETAKRGYFENVKKGGDGGLWFNADKELIDYDGYACLPMSVIRAIRSMGYTVCKSFE